VVLNQHGQDTQTVPNSAFVVSRTVRKTERSESSSYFLDGRQISYSEIQTLLKGYGIDLDHKRFLILQVLIANSGRSRIYSIDET
jgi:structural maintenance of chromosome 4